MPRGPEAASVATAILDTVGGIIFPGAGHPAISGPPATAGGSVSIRSRQDSAQLKVIPAAFPLHTQADLNEFASTMVLGKLAA